LAVSQEVQVAHSFLALLASHVLQLEQEARERAAAARARVRKRFIKGRNGWLVRRKEKGPGIDPGPKILLVGLRAHVHHWWWWGLLLGSAGGKASGKNDSCEEQ
jgi:hypothetical protein